MRTKIPQWVPADTSPEAARIQFAVLQKLGPEGRARMGFELSEAVRQIAIAGIRQQHPNASEAEIRRELFRRVLSPELFREVCRHLAGERP